MKEQTAWAMSPTLREFQTFAGDSDTALLLRKARNCRMQGPEKKCFKSFKSRVAKTSIQLTFVNLVKFWILSLVPLHKHMLLAENS